MCSKQDATVFKLISTGTRSRHSELSQQGNNTRGGGTTKGGRVRDAGTRWEVKQMEEGEEEEDGRSLNLSDSICLLQSAPLFVLIFSIFI